MNIRMMISIHFRQLQPEVILVALLLIRTIFILSVAIDMEMLVQSSLLK